MILNLSLIILRFFLSHDSKLIQIEEAAFVLNNDRIDDFIFSHLKLKRYYFRAVLYKVGLYSETDDCIDYFTSIKVIKYFIIIYVSYIYV